MLSHDCMKAVYYAHTYSHLMYGLLIWGSMTSSKKIKKLATMQNSCIHLLGQKLNRYSTHRITAKELPKPLHNLLDSQGGRKTQRYETQNKETPNIQKHTSSQFNKSFMCKSLLKYNQLSPEIKETNKTKNFISRTKHTLLQ